MTHAEAGLVHLTKLVRAMALFTVAVVGLFFAKAYVSALWRLRIDYVVVILYVQFCVYGLLWQIQAHRAIHRGEM